MKLILFCLLSILPASFAHANSEVELNKINLLLAAVEKLDASFVRNGVEYSPSDAVAHLRRKLNVALRDAGTGEITARNFIDLIGSRSSATGLPYTIRFSDGREVSARSWLLRKLREIEGL